MRALLVMVLFVAGGLLGAECAAFPKKTVPDDPGRSPVSRDSVRPPGAASAVFPKPALDVFRDALDGNVEAVAAALGGGMRIDARDLQLGESLLFLAIQGCVQAAYDNAELLVNAEKKDGKEVRVSPEIGATGARAPIQHPSTANRIVLPQNPQPGKPLANQIAVAQNSPVALTATIPRGVAQNSPSALVATKQIVMPRNSLSPKSAGKPVPVAQNSPPSKSAHTATNHQPRNTAEYLKLIRLLLDKGADPNLQNPRYPARVSALADALSYGGGGWHFPERLAIVEMLLVANAKILMPPGKRSLFSIAAVHRDAKVISALARTGEKALPRDLDRFLPEAQEAGNVEFVGALLMAGANPSVQVPPLLGKAVLSRQVDIVGLLLMHRADVAEIINGETLLTAALPQGKWSLESALPALMILKMLLENGADPNKSDLIRGTPLEITASVRAFDLPIRIEAIRVLLKHHADPNILHSGRTVLMRVTEDEQIIALLLEHGARIILDPTDSRFQVHGVPGDITYAISDNKPTLAGVLIKRAKTLSRNDKRALWMATERENAAIVKALLAKGADAEYRIGGRTVLHEAGEAGKADLVKMLIEHKANLDAKTNRPSQCENLTWKECARSFLGFYREGDHRVFAETALMLAAGKQNTEVVRILLNAGADPQLKNSAGDTAHSIAAKAGLGGGKADLLKLLDSAAGNRR